MDLKKKEQISFTLLKQALLERGVFLKRIKKKELRKKARRFGISVEEAREYLGILFREMVNELYPAKKSKKNKKGKKKKDK